MHRAGVAAALGLVLTLGACVPGPTAGNGEAELRLARLPEPQDTGIALLVMERPCASGRSADGRIVVDELTVTADEVRIRVSVRPPPGRDQTCPSNPWTPYLVDLGAPIRDRTVVDAAVVPPKGLEVGTEEAVFDPAAEDRDAAVERALSLEVWPDYTLLVETSCFCDVGTSRVVVRDGQVVSRRRIDDDGTPTGDEVSPELAPSLSEVLDRLRTAYTDDPKSITDITVDASGLLVRVAFDPIREAVDDEIGYGFDVDVDSPGAP